MKNWHLIEQQPLLSEIYKNPPLISYKRGVHSKTYSWDPIYKKGYFKHGLGSFVGLSTPFYAKLYGISSVEELAKFFEKDVLPIPATKETEKIATLPHERVSPNFYRREQTRSANSFGSNSSFSQLFEKRISNLPKRVASVTIDVIIKNDLHDIESKKK